MGVSFSYIFQYCQYSSSKFPSFYPPPPLTIQPNAPEAPRLLTLKKTTSRLRIVGGTLVISEHHWNDRDRSGIGLGVCDRSVIGL